MNVIMVMFDTLNRRFLEPYGGSDVHTPNFQRLAEHTVRFDNCYAGSLPCIPARRELLTGRYNFLHRSWGPMEPFDDSMPQLLRTHDVYSHLISDHGHYWECGGATYHTQYSSWENIRGQEGDPWIPAIGELSEIQPNFVKFDSGLRKKLYRQHQANRTRICTKKDFPLVKTFDAGLLFLEENHNKQPWFLQIESFAPHEPFMASADFAEKYTNKETNHSVRYEWPDYGRVTESKDTIEAVRNAYCADLAMCDQQLGRILDFMDAHQMWDSTMLIVNTDHGYLLGEHGYWGKNFMPCYDEIAHTPLFIWDPRYPHKANISRKSLVQTIDLPITILRFFGIELTNDMQGQDLAPVIDRDEQIRKNALFGLFGAHICCTDGRYVYMRVPRNIENTLYEYTLMPTHMMNFFSLDELKDTKMHEPFTFTKECPVMQITTDGKVRCTEKKDFLFDLYLDPQQKQEIHDSETEREMADAILHLMHETDAPEESYVRFGFPLCNNI